MERGGWIYEYDIFLVRGFDLVVFSWVLMREAVGTVVKSLAGLCSQRPRSEAWSCDILAWWKAEQNLVLQQRKLVLDQRSTSSLPIPTRSWGEI